MIGLILSANARTTKIKNREGHFGFSVIQKITLLSLMQIKSATTLKWTPKGKTLKK